MTHTIHVPHATRHMTGSAWRPWQSLVQVSSVKGLQARAAPQQSEVGGVVVVWCVCVANV